MGIFDKAKEALGNNPDKAEQGIDKAEDFAKDKFGDHADKVDKAGDKAREFVRGHGDEEQQGQ